MREWFYVTSSLSEKKTLLANRNSDTQKKNQVSCDWCSPCIRCFGWLKGLPEDLCVELLCFLTGNWKGLSGHLQNAPSLKYIASSNNTDLASVSNSADHTRIYLSSEESHISWLAKWSGIFRNDAKYYSIHEYTQKEIINLDRREYEKLYGWLNQHPKITEVSISKFVERLLGVVTDLTESHILYQSLFTVLWM
jgi:hypothetical protein